MKPLVSIVTPTFNVALFLAATLAGIKTQTFPDWELIAVDDCSTDGTVDIATDFAARDNRVKVIILKENSGPAVARNRAIELARGRYIAFCDSDDVWLPEKLEKQLAFMTQKDAAVSFTSYFKIEESGKVTDRLVHARPLVTYRSLLRSNYIGCSTAMYDTAKTGKVFMPNIIKRQDYGLWLRITRQGYVAHGLSEPLVYYRVRNKSVSSDKLLAAKFHWKVLREVAQVPLPMACWLFLQYAYLGFRKASS